MEQGEEDADEEGEEEAEVCFDEHGQNVNS